MKQQRYTIKSFVKSDHCVHGAKIICVFQRKGSHIPSPLEGELIEFSKKTGEIWVTSDNNEYYFADKDTTGHIYIPNEKEKKRFLTIKIKKTPDAIEFTLKATAELENFFKSEKKMSSARWLLSNRQGAEFYQINQEANQKWDEFLSVTSSFSDVGTLLLDNQRRVNMAFLRTVGISRGVKVITPIVNSTLIDNFELEYFVSQFVRNTKEFYRKYIQEKTISATVSYEL